ncbi:Pentatricopeptide repeat-containing protein [Apostasia shenzhenica]|uniref:Pentatricopeptide repeat-containing protein n=1 Tax=Apostasia shenzhenica TaxID=1088818 RepID=A0A2I0AWS4_9ASPA|nr:Pentatricopeptide repeat-containing protein [Apostasia shenzhenica]
MSRFQLISTTSRIVSLCRSGLLSAARQLFDEMPERDTVAWNAMLAAYCRSGFPSHTLSLFFSMRSCCTPQDPFSFTSALAAAADLGDLLAGEKLQSLAIRCGLCSFVPVCNSIVDLYGKCYRPSEAMRVFKEIVDRNEVSWCSLLHGFVVSGLLGEACKVFNEMPTRNLVAWNVMIKGFASCGEPKLSIDCFKEMLVSGCSGDFLTFSSLINFCAELSDPLCGKMIHALIIRNGWIDSVEVSNSVLSFYGKFNCYLETMRIFNSIGARSLVSWNAMIDAHMKFGNIEGAVSLFHEAPETNIVSWTSMVSGFARNSNGEEALHYFVNMMRNSHKPDDFTFGAILHACSLLTVLANGKMFHGLIIHCGFECFVYVSNGLINMYAKCGDIKSSSEVFDGIAMKDIVSWNAMIFGFAVHGCSQRALEVFKAMVASCIQPDKLTFIGLLMACCHSGLLEQGMGFLSSMESVHGISPDLDHLTCIVDMIGRSGYSRKLSNLIEEMNAGYSEALLNASNIYGDLLVGRRAGEWLMMMEPLKEGGYVMLSNLYCFNGRWREAEIVRRLMVKKELRKTPGCSWIEVGGIVMVFVSGSSLSPMVHLHNLLSILESEMRNPSSVGAESG